MNYSLELQKENDVIETAMTYGAAGLAVVGGAAWLWWAMLKRAVHKTQTETDVDRRVIALAEQYTGLIDSLRSENARLTNEVIEERRRYSKLVDDQHVRQEQIVENVRKEHRDAVLRIHARLDHCDQQHAQCSAENAECRAENAAIRAENAVVRAELESVKREMEAFLGPAR